MNQTRLGSFIEAVMNTAVGLGINLAVQRFLFPLFGFDPPFTTNLAIADRRVGDFIAGAAWHMANPDGPLGELQGAAESWATEHAAAGAAPAAAPSYTCISGTDGRSCRSWCGDPKCARGVKEVPRG